MLPTYYLVKADNTPEYERFVKWFNDKYTNIASGHAFDYYGYLSYGTAMTDKQNHPNDVKIYYSAKDFWKDLNGYSDKPSGFIIYGKPYHLEAFWRDLKDVGYIPSQSYSHIELGSEYIQSNIPSDGAINHREYSQVFLSDSIQPRKGLVEFHLPANYSEGLKYCQNSYLSTYWNDLHTIENEWYVNCFDNSIFRATGRVEAGLGNTTRIYYSEAFNASGSKITMDGFLSIQNDLYNVKRNIIPFKEAKFEDVQKRLIETAKLKGYVKGVTFKTAGKLGGKQTSIVNDNIGANVNDGEIYLYSNMATIYYKGEWAEILPKAQKIKLSNGKMVEVIAQTSITYDEGSINISGLRELIAPLHLGGWSAILTDATFKIGCWENVTLADINKVINAYNKK